MLHLDEKPETIHLYVVREDEIKPFYLPILLSTLALCVLIVVCAVSPYSQPEVRKTLRLPAVFLPVQTYSTSVEIIPTGVRTYPATYATGILTITNGSIISQMIPQGFIVDGVSTDSAVFVPAGSANGYGYATVSAHALTSGRNGNIRPLAINVVEGSSMYIRNLTAFTGGKDRYSVKVETPWDRQTALHSTRLILATETAKSR